jgi:hypothetical protein
MNRVHLEVVSRAQPVGRTLSAVVAISFLCATAQAGIVADETQLGDFSNDGLAPTHFSLVAGTNVVAGTFGASALPDVHDLDYVSFTVPAGHVMSRFVLIDAYVGGAFSFVGMQAGPALTVPPDNWSIETPLLGWAHFGSSSIGRDLLPEMAVSPGSVGFTTPLPSGTYSLWIMELDTSESYRYRFGIEVVAVPGPGALATVAMLARAFSRQEVRRRNRR